MNDHIQPAERVGKQVSWWLVIGVLVLAVAALVGAALYISHRMAFKAGHAKGQETAVRLTATCPAPREGFHILACTLSEADYRNTCRKRFKKATQ